MERREFVSIAGVAGLGLTMGGTAPAAGPPEEGKQPNILFIMTDQQHAGMMSCTGNKYLKTPAMDRLAREGIRLEKAYVANPVCVPRLAHLSYSGHLVQSGYRSPSFTPSLSISAIL